MLDAFAIFYHDVEGFPDSELMRIEERERGRKRETCVFPAVCTGSFRSARLSPWTWIDFYTQLRATDWNRVTFYIYPHFPLTIGLPEMVASITELLPTDDYGVLRSLCSRFEKCSEILSTTQISGFWTLSISRFPPCFISPRKYRINFSSRHLPFKRPDLLPSVI